MPAMGRLLHLSSTVASVVFVASAWFVVSGALAGDAVAHPTRSDSRISYREAKVHLIPEMTQTYRGYVHALKRGDGQTICEQIFSAEARKQAIEQELAVRDGKVGQEVSCATAMKRLAVFDYWNDIRLAIGYMRLGRCWDVPQHVFQPHNVVPDPLGGISFSVYPRSSMLGYGFAWQDPDGKGKRWVISEVYKWGRPPHVPPDRMTHYWGQYEDVSPKRHAWPRRPSENQSRIRSCDGNVLMSEGRERDFKVSVRDVFPRRFR